MIHYSEGSPLAEYLYLNGLLSPQQMFSNPTNSPPPEQEETETALTYGQFVMKLLGRHHSSSMLRLLHFGLGDALQLAYVKYRHKLPYNPINAICNWELPLYLLLNLLSIAAFCWGNYFMLLLCLLPFATTPRSTSPTHTIHHTLHSIHSQLKLKCFLLETQIVAAKAAKHTQSAEYLQADVRCLVTKINQVHNIYYPTAISNDILSLWRYFQAELLARNKPHLKDGMNFNPFKWKYHWIRGQLQIIRVEKALRLFSKFDQIQKRNNAILSLQQTAQLALRKCVDYSSLYYAFLLKNMSADSKAAISALLKCYQVRQLLSFYSQKVHLPHPTQLQQPVRQVAQQSIQQIVEQEPPPREYQPELLSEYQADLQGLKFKLQAILDVPETRPNYGQNESAQVNDLSWKYSNQPAVSFGLGILPPPRDMSEFVYE